MKFVLCSCTLTNQFLCQYKARHRRLVLGNSLFYSTSSFNASGAWVTLTALTNNTLSMQAKYGRSSHISGPAWHLAPVCSCITARFVLAYCLLYTISAISSQWHHLQRTTACICQPAKGTALPTTCQGFKLAPQH